MCIPLIGHNILGREKKPLEMVRVARARRDLLRGHRDPEKSRTKGPHI
jgi:hypothetical protein